MITIEMMLNLNVFVKLQGNIKINKCIMLILYSNLFLSVV